MTGLASATATWTARAARAITSRAKPASKTSRLIPYSASKRSAEKSQCGASCWCKVWTLTLELSVPAALASALRNSRLPSLPIPIQSTAQRTIGSPLADQDDAPAAQRVDDLLRRVVSQRAADGRRGVDGEHAHLQGLVSSGHALDQDASPIARIAVIRIMS